MSAASAASLSAALLVTRNNAQLSRGLAQPMTERLGFAMRGINTRDTQVDSPPPTEPAAPATPPGLLLFVAPPSPILSFSRLSLRVDEMQRLRLRLAAAHLGKSRQVILSEALEHYFKRVSPALLREHCPCIEGSRPAAIVASAAKADREL